MEKPGMKQMATLLAGFLLAGTAGAGDVYVTKDAQGHAIYTDTPLTMPAQKVVVHGQGGSEDTTAQGNSPDMSRNESQDQAASNVESGQAASRKSSEDVAADRAKHCIDARQQYQALMSNWRIYDEDANGQRSYLSSEQIDQARANAKQAMDEFCADQ